MAACNMFANLHGPTAVVTGTNHFLVPTGLLQAWYEHASPVDNPLAGGVVEVVHSTSEWIRDIFPAESTSMLSPRTRAMLHHAGHSGREFGPSTTRVVGTLPGMKPDPDASKPQLPYLLPALELRRLLAEARTLNESFTLTYKRVSKTGAPFSGRVVRVAEVNIDSMRRSSCTVNVESQSATTWWIDAHACDSEELALLPAPNTWLTGLLLSFPLAMRADGVHEVGCLA